MSGPLAGIRIVEVGSLIAVPLAAGILARQGAEVIKVEDVGVGDNLRFYGSQKNGLSAWFVTVNANKRSVALDLQHTQGKEALWRLLENADVFLEGFRPGVMDRLGFGAELVRERHPKLVYYSSSGFGPTGPYAAYPAYDPVIQSLSGWAGAQTHGDEPTLVRGMVADKLSALTGAQAITAALVQRGSTGRGQHVRLSMLDANIAFNWSDVMMHCSLLDGDAEHRPNLIGAYRLYRCADAWVSVSTGTDRQWASFCTVVGRPELATDDKFRTASARAARFSEWFNLMGELVADHAAGDIVPRLQAEDVPAAVVLAPAEVANDPHVRATGGVYEIEHPIAGRVLQPRGGATFSDGIPQPQPAPRHGEHTRDVLGEIGFSEADVQGMIEAGIARIAPT
ncbi:MAG: CoA transferase [Gammaproteobacteria bacterium]|nr:CoA transferase [Gammaproteobacteria bacterium]